MGLPNLSLITPLYFFLLDLKVIVSVFLTFKVIFFALSPLDKFLKSILLRLLKSFNGIS